MLPKLIEDTPTATGRRGRFSEMHGALCTQHGVAQQCMYANCLQMIQKKQWSA